ncbi:MAG TPA: hypothetical protein VFP58_08290 [Candidatus Eisenbacteria bacterium]|nr:hypothetical protein [Candidatus Eisenbacteria bacterium]
MKTRIWILALATALAAAPGAAQESSGMISSVLQALRLPRTTQEARTLGVPESDIRAILDKAREKRVRAADVNELFEHENRAIREHGPVDNFGAFVQRRLDEGLRGRDLAEAIRAEHAARGKGKGHGGGPEAEKGKGHAKTPAEAKDQGRPETPAADKGKGHPETPAGDKGKKGGSR